MSRPRCDLCGEWESENTTIEPGYGACQDCIHRLVENEIALKAYDAEVRAFQSQHGGGISGESERQAMKESGRDRG